MIVHWSGAPQGCVCLVWLVSFSPLSLVSTSGCNYFVTVTTSELDLYLEKRLESLDFIQPAHH